MRKIKSTLSKITSVDIFLITALGLYMIILISNLLKMID